MVGLDEGLLPHSRSIDDLDAMEEERRLCYVGITRAMDRLYLLHTFRRTIFGSSQLSIASRFLADLPAEVIQGKPSREERRPVLTGAEPRRQVPITSWSVPSNSVGSDPRRSSGRATPPAAPRYRVGDTVVHAKFGEGVVVGSHVTEDDQEVEVAFPGHGIKKLSVSFAPLEKKG
jgi:DNA helicase-2/ATP-dependent DNA helicase PcrA